MVTRQQPYVPYRPNRFERAVDSVFRAVAPGLALRHARNRERYHAFGWEAGRIGRLRQSATRSGNVASNAPSNLQERTQIVWEARDLVRNFPFVSSLVAKIKDYTLGPNLLVQSRTGDKEDDDAIERYLRVCWANCDYSRQRNFSQLTRDALGAVVTDGDLGSIIHEVPVEAAGIHASFLQLQLIQSDRIGGFETVSRDGRVAGVEFDPTTGAPVSYRIFDRDVHGSYGKHTDVPADKFIFLLNRNFPDELRGTSLFASAIPTLRDIKEVLENERIGVKWATSIAGVISTEGGSAESDNPGDIYDGDAAGVPVNPQTGQPYRTQNAQPGTLLHLATGEKAEAFRYDRPSPAFQGLLSLLYREVCMAANVPYGFAYDSSILGGVVARLESAQAQRTFAVWQAYIHDAWLIPICRMMIFHGLRTKQLSLKSPSALRNPVQLVVSWPAHPTVDVGRESTANVNEYNTGLKSFSSIVAEQGKDPETELRRIARDAKMAIEIAQQEGVPPEYVLGKKIQSPSGISDTVIQQQSG